MASIGSKLTRAAPLSTASSFQPKPLTRATPLSAAKPTSNTPAPAKHPGLPEGGPKYSPFEKTTGEAGNLMVSGGDNKLTAPANARQNVLLDKPGNPFQKDVFGGTVKANLGSAQASTTHHSGGGVFHHSAQAELHGPNASFELQKAHAGRLGVTSGQLTAEANSFKAQAQAGVSADTKSHAYTAALTAKAETGVGVTASAAHDFNRHVGAFVKGEAKASATAFAEGTASLDPKSATAMLSGQVGAAATAGVYGTAGGHLGRLHGSVTAGAVAGAAAQAGGKLGLENGFLKHSADVNAAAGVGTHLKTDVAVDLRHHLKPGVASGLRPGLAAATAVGSPASALAPEKSKLEKFFSKAFGG
jgi:hypothetical protein